MKKLIIVGLIFLMLVSAGCITTCIPVTPTAKYQISDSDTGVFIIGGSPVRTYSDVFKKLEVNKTTMVKFEVLPSKETVINSVCPS
jgi:hypothetical protein